MSKTKSPSKPDTPNAPDAPKTTHTPWRPDQFFERCVQKTIATMNDLLTLGHGKGMLDTEEVKDLVVSAFFSTAVSDMIDRRGLCRHVIHAIVDDIFIDAEAAADARARRGTIQ